MTTDSKQVADTILPELPESLDEVRAMFRGEWDYASAGDNYYTASQMRAYATEAVRAALASRSQPQGEPVAYAVFAQPAAHGEALIPCPCCPQAIRNLAAVAHNVCVRTPNIYDGELKRAVDQVKPLMDAHFANHEHSHGEALAKHRGEIGRPAAPVPAPAPLAQNWKPTWINVDFMMPDPDVEVLIDGHEGVEIATYSEGEEDQVDSMGHDAGFWGMKFAACGRSFGNPDYMHPPQGQPQYWAHLPDAPSDGYDDGEIAPQVPETPVKVGAENNQGGETA